MLSKDKNSAIIFHPPFPLNDKKKSKLDFEFTGPLDLPFVPFLIYYKKYRAVSDITGYKFVPI